MRSPYSLKITGQVSPEPETSQTPGYPLSARSTTLDGWRLTVEEGLGRLKWKYLATEAERNAQPQDKTSRFFLDLPITEAPEHKPAQRPSEAATNGALFHSQLQVKELGCWAADLSCIFFVTPMLIIAWYITQATIDEAQAIELINFIFGAQNPDGGWATYVGEDTTVMGTILVYVALRLMGLSAEHQQLIKARRCLLDMGGAVYLPGWAKFWLALLGLYKWEGTDPYPVEMWLLPEWLPISPWKWFLIPRQVYVAMSYLAAKKFTIPTNPLLEEIRTEIFVQPYHSIDFIAFRGVTILRSREVRKSWVLNLVNWLLDNIWYPWFRPEGLAATGEETAWHIIEQSNKATNSLGAISVDGFLNMIAVYCREGPDSKTLHQIHNASQEYLWLGPKGMQVMSVSGGHVWETSFALLAYAESGLANLPDFRPTVERAYKFLVDNQHVEDWKDTSSCHFFSRLGGWPFTTRYNGITCSDCTGEALKAILMLERNSEIPRLTNEHTRRLAVDDLLIIQNPSGGYSSFEPIRGSELLEHMNGTEIFQDVMVEYDYVECTSSCITALALFQSRYPTYRAIEINRAIHKGNKFILSRQQCDGGWLSAWGIAFTYGTFFALEALACGGMTYGNHEAVKRGCEFILGKQQADGGWGEKIDVGFSSYPHILHPEPIRRGIRLIMSRQNAKGEWKQERAVGSGIVTCELLYHNYMYSFPIRALTMYKERFGDEILF
ncbi:terpene synthase [Aspergillus steynii IBT 23096]|uniref:Terpene cyclase/mutase family member n=1 Tax=Aspergillus steynii IBT 23096 TaxID=1392250 RepID=A0A2I2GD95_9EURO|nr:terpene synthase [Aspergillus steynii IBT 23096]PLB50866.1 terpene synthase [Aspergillus steynii IBT 23096]